MGQRLIKWSYCRGYQECIMCFLSPNSKDVWSLRLMLILKTPSHWYQIWHTRHTPPRFSINKTDSPATRLPGFTRFSGMITPKMKPRGNMKNSCNPTNLAFFRQGNRYQTSPAFTIASISGQDSIFKGEDHNIPCYGSPNFFSNHLH
jgi:hypothetical protein